MADLSSLLGSAGIGGATGGSGGGGSMLTGQVLSALRARGQATLEASAAHATGSSPRLFCELEEAIDPVNEGPGERPPLGPGHPPSIHASGVDCWSGLVERLENRPLSVPDLWPHLLTEGNFDRHLTPGRIEEDFEGDWYRDPATAGLVEDAAIWHLSGP